MEEEKNEDGFFKSIWSESCGSILIELIWNVIMFIPRLLF